MQRTLLLGLNEINFDFVRRYVDRGRLPNFAGLMERHGVTTTIAETKYEELEPWIQWATVQTGKTYAEHGVFRLGDMVGRAVPQYFELLEERGLKVGAISPMNAANKLKRSPYFVPDPWTRTPASGSFLVRLFSDAVSKAVNSNAHGAPSLGAALVVAAGLLRFSKPRHYSRYAELIARSVKLHWPRAMVLDLLLFDVHNALYAQHRPDFSTLFLNAGAHIQHHYLFNSTVIVSNRKNPEWYVSPQADPVLEIYELYDLMLGELRERFPDSRLILATGLRQVPYPEVVYYYRLRHHRRFLERLGVAGITAVNPRMSRDFLITLEDELVTKKAERALREAHSEDGRLFFEEVENRGTSLFVTLTWPDEIPPGTSIRVNGKSISDLHREVSLVAIKNGHHDSRGYVIDTESTPGQTREDMPLGELFSWVMGASEHRAAAAS